MWQQRQACGCPKLVHPATQAAIDLPTAYAVQRRLTALRTGRGAARIGYKLGYTSQAMREQILRIVEAPTRWPSLSNSP